MPIPWTLSIFVNAWHPSQRAQGQVGVDFYGRESESLWFHLPRRDREKIATLLLVALLVQLPDLTFNMIYSSYMASSTWPGQFLTGFWLLLQIIMQVSASVMQGKAEGKARRANPGRFPPTVLGYLHVAYRKWRAENEDKEVRCWSCHVCCGEGSFKYFVRAELKKHQLDRERFGGSALTTGIEANVVMHQNRAVEDETRAAWSSIDGTGGVDEEERLKIATKASGRSSLSCPRAPESAQAACMVVQMAAGAPHIKLDKQKKVFPARSDPSRGSSADVSAPLSSAPAVALELSTT